MIIPSLFLAALLGQSPDATGQRIRELEARVSRIEAKLDRLMECRRSREAIGRDWYDSILRESQERMRRVEEKNAEYYRRTGRKPVPYWDMPY